MPDNKKLRGKADQARVSKQPHEQKQLAKSTGKSPAAVKAATVAAGPMRKNVKAALKK